MIWAIDKAQQRFDLAHAKLGTAQTQLQRFLEEQLEATGAIKSYGTSSSPSQQLKNKLSQAMTIPGGMLTLSLESRAVHDRAVATLVDDWGTNVGWQKSVSCVAIVHPADAGWKLATIVEWSPSDFPRAVRERLFPDVVVKQAVGSPAAEAASGTAVKSGGQAKPGALYSVDARRSNAEVRAAERLPVALVESVMALSPQDRAAVAVMIIESLVLKAT